MGHKEKHYINGIEAPSVTQVCNVLDKPFLKIWFGKLGLQKAQAIVKESQEIGRRVHEAFEAYFRGDICPTLDQNEKRMLDLLVRWAIDSGFHPVELERHVESKEYSYHGTFDAIGHFGDDLLVVLDWKTSSAVDQSYGMQLSAYAQAYKEETGTEITTGYVIRVDKKEDAKSALEVKKFENLPKYFDVFLRCRDVWDFVNHRGKWAK